MPKKRTTHPDFTKHAPHLVDASALLNLIASDQLQHRYKNSPPFTDDLFVVECADTTTSLAVMREGEGSDARYRVSSLIDYLPDDQRDMVLRAVQHRIDEKIQRYAAPDGCMDQAQLASLSAEILRLECNQPDLGSRYARRRWESLSPSMIALAKQRVHPIEADPFQQQLDADAADPLSLVTFPDPHTAIVVQRRGTETPASYRVYSVLQLVDLSTKPVARALRDDVLTSIGTHSNIASTLDAAGLTALMAEITAMPCNTPQSSNHRIVPRSMEMAFALPLQSPRVLKLIEADRLDDYPLGGSGNNYAENIFTITFPDESTNLTVQRHGRGANARYEVYAQGESDLQPSRDPIAVSMAEKTASRAANSVDGKLSAHELGALVGEVEAMHCNKTAPLPMRARSGNSLVF